jgi:hypothetical protein
MVYKCSSLQNINNNIINTTWEMSNFIQGFTNIIYGEFIDYN